ncbi:glycosyltransferase family 2 protein [Angustibacter sp. Root456]|uniref:glycosyltransferase family 2 protein n=1 Tax=Angustibacter sp. Root456 TaxID=1736539 RepID=UPI0006FD28D4|nr:glycosyltransferase [Angustibacter sp. Root456]KQX69921.1 glycosyl transferase [Angustibacter sp. Root456]
MGLTLGVVVLTMGDRPVELARAVESLRRQTRPPESVLVIGNGADVPDQPDFVRVLRLPDNLGIVGGRDLGWRELDTDLVQFLDDDAWLLDDDVLAGVVRRFEDDPRLGIVSMRIVDPDTGLSSRRHVPRLRTSDPERSSDVTTFLGGASVVRREVLERCGGLPAAFWYGHEETDLAWAALDDGWRIHYAADAVLGHPTTTPARHATYYRLNARNRVWLARRRLPWPLAAVYLAVWTALTVVRVRDSAALRTWARGFVEGWRTDAGPRRPMRWSTAWRMTRHGRPPVV